MGKQLIFNFFTEHPDGTPSGSGHVNITLLDTSVDTLREPVTFGSNLEPGNLISFVAGGGVIINENGFVDHNNEDFYRRPDRIVIDVPDGFAAKFDELYDKFDGVDHGHIYGFSDWDIDPSLNNGAGGTNCTHFAHAIAQDLGINLIDHVPFNILNQRIAGQQLIGYELTRTLQRTGTVFDISSSYSVAYAGLERLFSDGVVDTNISLGIVLNDLEFFLNKTFKPGDEFSFLDDRDNLHNLINLFAEISNVAYSFNSPLPSSTFDDNSPSSIFLSLDGVDLIGLENLGGTDQFLRFDVFSGSDSRINTSFSDLPDYDFEGIDFSGIPSNIDFFDMPDGVSMSFAIPTDVFTRGQVYGALIDIRTSGSVNGASLALTLLGETSNGDPFSSTFLDSTGEGVFEQSYEMMSTENSVIVSVPPSESSNPNQIKIISPDEYYEIRNDPQAVPYSHRSRLDEGGTVSRSSVDAALGDWHTTVQRAPQIDTDLALVGEEIGAIFGSTLGQVIGGDNVFAQIGAGSALSALLGNVGEAVGLYFGNDGLPNSSGVPTQDLSFEDATEKAFGNFGEDLFLALKSQAVGALSGFLATELGEAIGVGDGFGGQLFSSVAGQTIGHTLNTVLGNIGQPDLFAGLGEGLFFNAANGPGTLTAGIGAFIGSYLASELVAPETTAGAIGSSVGSSLGTLVALAGLPGGLLTGALSGTFIGSIATGLGTALTGAFGAFANIILPGIGAFIGAILGTFLGDFLSDIFGGGDGPSSYWGYQDVDYNSETGEFEFGEYKADKDIRRQDIKVIQAMAEGAVGILNPYLGLIGGDVISVDPIRFYIAWTAKTQHFRIQSAGGGEGFQNKNGEGLTEKAVLATLKKGIKVAGGNLYIKRALALSKAQTLEELNGDLTIASDYARYLANKELIDAVIAMDPDSAFAAGWVITLLRAEELGITEWNQTDFYGGLKYFFDAFGFERFDATVADISVSMENDTLVLELTPDGTDARRIEIADFVALTGLKHLAPTGSKTVTADNADTLWFAQAGVDSIFEDQSTHSLYKSSDVLIGNSGNDTIQAGLGADFVDGGAGNDIIFGGLGDDTLKGGAGDDHITGDWGRDILAGGEGNDTLEGGLGDDFYIFNRGDGSDIIIDDGTGNGTESQTFSFEEAYIDTRWVTVEETITVVGRSGEYGGTYPVTGEFGDYTPWNDSYGYNGEGATGLIPVDVTIEKRVEEEFTAHRTVSYDIKEKQDGGFDTLHFGNGISVSDLVTEFDGKDLLVGVLEAGKPDTPIDRLSDKVRLTNWLDPLDRIEKFRFADGSELDVGGIAGATLDVSAEADGVTWSKTSLVLNLGAGDDRAVTGNFDDVLIGGDGADHLTTNGGDDALVGGAGVDTLEGGAGSDTLDGGVGGDLLDGGEGDDTYIIDSVDDRIIDSGGNDTILSSIDYALPKNIENLTLAKGAGDFSGTGNAQDNTLTGNEGDNVLSGGPGNDTYQFNRGSGQDVVINKDDDAATTDKLVLGNTITHEDLWFVKLNDDLVVSVLGSTDSITFDDWFVNEANRIDEFIGRDGAVLSGSDANQLVSAMAGFSPSTSSDSSGVQPDDLPEPVQLAIDSAWQTGA